MPSPSDPDAPIGIFDSGVGGLTVARAVLDQLPHEPVLYVGDTARGPYGPRPIAEVRAFALESWTTSSTRASSCSSSRATAPAPRSCATPGSGTTCRSWRSIQPAVRRAVARHTQRRVGVIGTAGDVTSGAYEDAFAAAPHVTRDRRRPARGSSSSWRRASPVVTSCSTSPHGYLDPIAAEGVDTLVLGCTHYPLLTGVISYVMGDDVTLVSAPRRPRRTSTGCWPTVTSCAHRRRRSRSTGSS